MHNFRASIFVFDVFVAHRPFKNSFKSEPIGTIKASDLESARVKSVGLFPGAGNLVLRVQK